MIEWPNSTDFRLFWKQFMLRITQAVALDVNEIHFTYLRSPGPGGQNVNKVATTALLRFDLAHSASLPDTLRERLLQVLGNRLTQHGELIIKASRFRTQERNRQDALERLTNYCIRRPYRVKRARKPSLVLGRYRNVYRRKSCAG